jgi:hypothetical protein
MPVQPGLPQACNVGRQTLKPATRSQVLSDCVGQKKRLGRVWFDQAQSNTSSVWGTEELVHGLRFSTWIKTNSRSLFMEIVTPVFAGKLIGKGMGTQTGAVVLDKG